MTYIEKFSQLLLMSDSGIDVTNTELYDENILRAFLTLQEASHHFT